MSAVGLVPVMALAQRAGLSDLVDEHVSLTKPSGCNAPVKVSALVAGMVAGADSIDDMGLLRHGGMHRIFGGIRAPSTCGTFLRTFTFGHVLQLAAVSRRLLANLTGHAPLLPGADQISFLDIDDTMKATYGYAKQGAGYGYNGVKGLNALLGTVTTPTGAPLICGALLRRGSTGSARGAARFVASCVHTAQGAGAGRGGGLVVMRADSAFDSPAVVAAVGRAGACFSITARQNRSVQAAIATIDAQAWTPIQYLNAIFDEAEQRWISDAEVAEIDYTAFTSRAKAEHVTARLIVRRVTRLHAAPKASGQGVLFDTYRYQLSRPGARCRCCRPFPQAARRTRRADLSATGSPRSLPSGLVGQVPGVGDRVASIPVTRHRHRGEVEHHDPVRRDWLPRPSGGGEPPADVLPLPPVQLHLPADHSPPRERGSSNLRGTTRSCELSGPGLRPVAP